MRADPSRPSRAVKPGLHPLALSRPSSAARILAACACCSACLFALPARADLTAAQISADSVPQPLTAVPGDAAHGRALLLARENANCILCHAIPEARFSGDLGPALAGVGARLSAPQLRLRVADNARVHPSTIMPSYFRSEGLIGVAAQYRGKTVLSAQEVEDVVAYLQTLK
jgi:sulfur-oxidizing protein SoxX